MADKQTADDDAMLLDAYLDGELDAAASLAIEHRLHSEPEAQAEYARLVALRSALRAKVPRDQASFALRAKLATLAAPAPSRPQHLAWRQMAASGIAAALVASLGTAWWLGPGTNFAGGEKGDIASIVAEHRRALLSASPVDVASSDQHTVKPWFDAKLALSPTVVDLAADGFPLAGGRVEVVAGKLVPAMLYKRRAHLISLIAVPHAGSREDGAPAVSSTQDGYTVTRWPGQDFEYVAVSDVVPDELAEFVKDWRGAKP